MASDTDSLPCSWEDAKNLEKSGTSIPLHFFWGHRPERDGSVGDGCFSQWFNASFTENGSAFRTGEHYMMFRKALLFQDYTVAPRILKAETPREAKRLGRQVRGFKESVWVDHRVAIVSRGNLLKFSQNAALRRHLMSTRGKLLVEASPYDRIWGIGMSRTQAGSSRVQSWRGMNLLGFALTHVRDVSLGV